MTGHPSYDFANILFAGPCNLHCPYCIGRQLDPTLNWSNLDRFPPRNLERFLGLLQRYHVRNLVLSGTNTDPQLYRYEGPLIELLRQQLPGISLSLHTNGQLALPKIELFNRYDRVTLSLPSFDPEVYMRMTGSRRVPDLAAIMRASRVPVKVSCILDAHNIGQLGAFLDRCQRSGIRRVVLRQQYGDPRQWELPPQLRPVGSYRHNPVYEFRGMEVTYWSFEDTSSTALNLFSDGSISRHYLLAAHRGRGPSRSGIRSPAPSLSDSASG